MRVDGNGIIVHFRGPSLGLFGPQRNDEKGRVLLESRHVSWFSRRIVCFFFFYSFEVVVSLGLTLFAIGEKLWGWGLLVRKTEKGLIKLLMGMYGYFFFFVVCEGTGVWKGMRWVPQRAGLGSVQ